MNAALLLTALFNGAWQGALLCALAVLAFRMFRRLNATTMFTVWSVLLAIAVLLPFANYAFAPKPVIEVRHSNRQVWREVGVMPGVMLRYRSAAEVSTPSSKAPASPSWFDKLTMTSSVTTAAAAATAAIKAVLSYAKWILLVLGAIALVRLAILGRDIVRMFVARSRVRPIDSPVALSEDIGRPFRYAASDDFSSPCVLGFAPALIVIPEELLAEPNAELTSVVLHEREHVRRFDDVQNVIQRFIGAIGFFCPGVRIAIRELALYREQICDDAAINATGDRVSYAMTLTDLAQWAQGRGTPVPSLIFKRKHLLHRLEVLLDSAVNHSLHVHRRFALAAATALVMAALLVLRIQLPVIAETFVAPTVHPTHVAHAKHVAHAAHVVHVAHAAHVAHVAPVERIARVAPKVHAHVQMRAPSAFAVPTVPVTRVAQVAAITPTAPQIAADVVGAQSSGDLLDALNAAGLHNLPVDELVKLRDHGVSAQLIHSATAYFGRIGGDDLVYLSDHGVGTNYLDSLRSNGISGITVSDTVRLMDHGVTAPLIRAALSGFQPKPSAQDLVDLADHGVTAPFIQSLRANGVTACWRDAVDMLDHGVDASYVARIRRMNPRATIHDIIRLHDAGF